MAKEKLTAADKKFIQIFLNGGNLDYSARVITRSNRFTGKTVEVCPVVAAAFDFVMRIEPILYSEAALKRVHPKLKPSNSRSYFDRARHIVSKMNTDAYMALLD